MKMPKAFIARVGYPVVVKPDNGVGASETYKLKSDEDLDYFFATKKGYSIHHGRICARSC